jgi:hypothetical protein
VDALIQAKHGLSFFDTPGHARRNRPRTPTTARSHQTDFRHLTSYPR